MSGPRRRTLVKRVGLALATGGTLVAILLGFLVGTEPGARLVVGVVEGRLPALASAGRVEGRLAGSLELRAVRIETDPAAVRIDRLALDLRLRELLGRRLRVEELSADGVAVVVRAPGPDGGGDRARERRRAGETPGAPAAGPRLLFGLQVDRATLRGLSIDAPGDLGLRRGQVRFAGSPRSYRLEGRGALRLPGRVSGSLNLSAHGDTDGLSFDSLVVRVPEGQARVEGRVGWSPAVGWDLRLAADSVSASALRPELENWPGRLSVRATSRGRWTADGPSGVIRVEALDGRLRGHDLAGRLELELDGKVRRARAVELRWGSARLSASGRVAEALDLTVDAVVPDLSLILPGGSGALEVEARVEGPRASPTGRARIRARGVRLDDTRLASLEGRANFDLTAAGRVELDLVAGGVAIEGRQLGRIALRGRGRRMEEMSAVAVDSLVIDLLEGRARVEGRVGWRPRVSWALRLTADTLAPAALFEEPGAWPGRLSLRATSEGSRGPDGPVGGLSVDTLRGELRGQAVAGRGRLEVRGESDRRGELRVRWGSARLSASGQLARELSLELEAGVPELSQIVPGAAGRLHLEGTLTGSRSLPELRAELSARALEIGASRLDTLGAELRLDLEPGGLISADVTGSRMVIEGRSIERFELRARGTSGEHELALTARAPERTLELSLVGGLEDRSWSGRMDRLVLRDPTAGAWQLAEPTGLHVAAGAVELDTLCLTSGAARVCGAGAWRRHAGWTVTSSLDSVPLELARGALPSGWTLAGSLDGSVGLSTGADGRLQGRVELRPGPGTLGFQTDGERRQARFDRGTVRVRVEPEGLWAGSDFRLIDTDGARLGMIAARLELPGYRPPGRPTPDQPVAGRLEARLSELGFAGALSPAVARTGGRLELDSDLEGTVGAPRFVGELRLRDGTATVPELGLRLTGLHLTVTGREAGGADISGRIGSGPGTIELEGTWRAGLDVEWPVRLRVRGERFLAMNVPAIELLASPDLEVRYAPGRVNVDGEVRVPAADIKAGKTLGMRTSVSEDVVFVDRAAAERGPGLGISGRVRIVLGDDVRLEPSGLSAALEGSLVVIEQPDRPTRATGELRLVDAVYRAYGQELTVERGRLAFAGGPIDNPGLEIRAVRQVADDVRVGLEVGGTAKSPEVTIFSEPPMPESDALTYLVLGQPLGGTAQSEGRLLTQAATSLGLKGGNFLARNIGSALGLSEARIETGTGLEGASVVAGRSITPQLFVGFGIDLFERAAGIRMRYLISSHWSLVGEGGHQTSAEIRYGIETGG